jgi:hypothetical protein
MSKLTEHGTPSPVHKVAVAQPKTPATRLPAATPSLGQKKKALARERIDLKEKLEQRQKAQDPKVRDALAAQITATIMRGSGYRSADQESNRDLADLAASLKPGTVGLLGIETAVELYRNERGIKTADLDPAPEILKRLDRLCV